MRFPLAHKPLTAFDADAAYFFASSKLPKSVAFPVVEKVIKSISSKDGSPPPQITMRIGELYARRLLLAIVVSPKSCASP